MNDIISVLTRMRRQGQLQDARRLAEDAYASGGDSPELIALLVDIYLDIEAECYRTGVVSFISEIDRRVAELLAESSDADRQEGRHRSIKLMALPGYSVINSFERMSMTEGCEQEAYDGVRAYMVGNPVDPRFHETVALILYRYLRACYTSIGAVAARRLLADYVALTVPAPSRLHSLMLRMAVRVARRYPEFNFARFFHIWNPAMLRPGDIPSLAVAALACVLDSPQASDFASLLELVPGSQEVKASILRDAFRYLVSAAVKKGDRGGARDLLQLYSRHGSIHAVCETHSAMLSLAIKVMDGDEAALFPEFFIKWDPFFFRLADYNPGKAADGKPLPSLAMRAMNRCFAVIKADRPRYSYLMPEIMRAFDSIAASMPGGPDELLERRRALILSWSDCEDNAVDRFSSLARRDESRSARFWLDFADVVRDTQAKMGVIALGIIRSKAVDDPDANELRVAMARMFHQAGLDDNAALELRLYREEVASMAAEPSAMYGAVARTVDTSVIPAESNDMLYHTLAAEALNLIYKRFPARPMSVIAADRDTLTISDGTSAPIDLPVGAWPIVARMSPGDNISVRFDRAGHPVAVNPMDAAPYSSLPLHYGVVMEINPLKIRCARKPDVIAADSMAGIGAGDTVTVRVYRAAGGERRGLAVEPVALAAARSHFSRMCVAIYDRLPDGRALYSAGPEELPGELPPSFAGKIDNFKPVDIYYCSLADGQRLVLSVTDPVDPAGCAALKTVSGQLCINADGRASVRDVAVSDDLLLSEKIDNHTFVTATAIYIPRTAAGTPVWQALTVAPYG